MIRRKDKEATYISRSGKRTKHATSCYVKESNGLKAYFSYDTIIGFVNTAGKVFIRASKGFSRTTGKHIRAVFHDLGYPAAIEDIPDKAFWFLLYEHGVLKAFEYEYGSSWDPPQ